MSYYDVYYNRINKYGNNIQERIQNKKEADFLKFMSKSPNRVIVQEGSAAGSYSGVLQTKSYDEEEVTNYLLVPVSEKIPMGTIITTWDIRHEPAAGVQDLGRKWINFAIDPYTSQGYNRYTIVEVENVMKWVKDGIVYQSYVHATGGGSGARDKAINLKFNVQFSESGVYLPNKRFSVVMPANEHLVKGQRVTLGDTTWKINGYDNISVPGVYYITMEEVLTSDTEDDPFAQAGDLEKWTIDCSLGTAFELEQNSTTDVLFSCFYDNDIRDEQIDIIIPTELTTIISYSNGQFITTDSEAEGFITARVSGMTQTDTEFEVLVIPSADTEITITGPNQLSEKSLAEYIVYSSEAVPTITISNTNAMVVSCVRNRDENNALLPTHTLTVKGVKMGSAQIQYKQNDTIVATKDIEILSYWMGG